jgi:hypothetical protein
MTTDPIDAYIEQLVDSAPPLQQWQRDTLSGLLNSSLVLAPAPDSDEARPVRAAPRPRSHAPAAKQGGRRGAA